jgi:Na+-transporting methylmalonyl-CoA/oxaloacetate decarboxylase gamma subunit
MQRFRFQNVLDADGISLSIIGMLIVFAALALVSLFIAALPKILERLNDYLPAEQTHHGGHGGSSGGELDEEEFIIAALGYVLHRELHKNA